MEIKEILESYNKYIARISIIDNEIFKIEQEVIDLKGMNLDGMPKPKGYVQSGLENDIVNKLDRVREKEQDKKQLQLEIDVINKLIATLKRKNQDIIKMRYINKMSYEEIAHNINRTVDLVNKVIYNSINNMQNEYNKKIT